jgi:hypothetical protein
MSSCDVYLSDVAYWSNIPIRVWEYTIGGYQVIKKWLSYREHPLLGRPLSKDEVRYVPGNGPPHRRHPPSRTRPRRQLRSSEAEHLHMAPRLNVNSPLMHSAP